MRKIKTNSGHFGLRKKVVLASLVLVFMLLLSGMIAFFEFGRMSRQVSEFIADNVTSVEISRSLLNLCDRYNSSLFQSLNEDRLSSVPEILPADVFEEDIALLRSTVRSKAERNLVDTVRYAYSAYMQVALDVDHIWLQPKDIRTHWYFENLQKSYDELRMYLQKLSSHSQGALTSNYDSLKASYYRSIMPGVVAIGASIILVILFSYFLNIYVLKPVLKMHKGIRDYRDYHKKYDVSFDYGGDQIQQMNEDLKEILDDNNIRKHR